jgi:AcrR family transcriptional regulator
VAQVSHRDRLLEGAMRCLQSKGYARTTARDIAEAAGATLASSGYHFGSKEALLNEALMRSFEQWTEEIVRRTLTEPDATPLERMATSWEVMLAAFNDCKPLLIAFVESMAQAQHSEELRGQLASFYDHIRQTIAETVRATLGPDAEQMGADADVIASFLIAIGDGLTLQWLLDPERTPDGDSLVSALGAALADAPEGARAPATNVPR